MKWTKKKKKTRIDAEKRSAAVNRLLETPPPLNSIIVVMEAANPGRRAKLKKYQLLTFIRGFKHSIKGFLTTHSDLIEEKYMKAAYIL